MPRRRLKRYKRSYSSKASRPIDKQIVTGYVQMASGGITQSQRFYPVTGDPNTGINFPGTVAGIRWYVHGFNNATTANTVRWAIVRVRENQLPGTIILGAGPQALYRPEQDVIVWGALYFPPSSDAADATVAYEANEGQTKSMRKLQNGDALYFVANDSVDTVGEYSQCHYCIQFFYKT